MGLLNNSKFVTTKKYNRAMAFTNFQNKEITCKIVYLGAKASGKTTNIRSLLKETHPELKTKIKSLSQPINSDHYFDFLPLLWSYSSSADLS